MIISKATLKDLKSCAEIYRIESAKPPYNKKNTSRKILKLFKEDFRTNSIYIVSVDNQIVGFIMVKTDSINHLWINELWILKEYQRQGIGRKLMKHIENIYRNKGVNTFQAVTNTGKGGAVNFNKKLNYKIDKSMVFMKKKITR